MADARLKIQSSCIQPVVQTQDLIESFYYPVITEPDSSYKVFFIQKTVYLEKVSISQLALRIPSLLVTLTLGKYYFGGERSRA